MGSRAGLVLGLVFACVVSIALGVVAVVTNEEEPAPSATPSPGALTEPPITSIVTTPPTTPTTVSSPTVAATPAQSPTPVFSPSPEPTPSEVQAQATAMTGTSSLLPWLGLALGLVGLLLIRSLRSAQ